MSGMKVKPHSSWKSLLRALGIACEPTRHNRLEGDRHERTVM